MIHYQDGFTQAQKDHFKSEDILQPVFRNGIMMRRQTLSDIRNTLAVGGF